MNSKLIVLGSLLMSLNSFAATNLDCVATDVYGGPLEESFSVEEYPEVTVTAKEVSIGASSYSKADGSSISIKTNSKSILVEVVTADESEQFDITVNKRTKKGTIVYKTPDTLEEMADITCK